MDRLEEIANNFQLVDPLVLLCAFAMTTIIGLYLITVTRTRVKVPRPGVYYNSRRDIPSCHDDPGAAPSRREDER